MVPPTGDVAAAAPLPTFPPLDRRAKLPQISISVRNMLRSRPYGKLIIRVFGACAWPHCPNPGCLVFRLLRRAT
jgi:hypothetical protein